MLTPGMIFASRCRHQRLAAAAACCQPNRQPLPVRNSTGPRLSAASCLDNGDVGAAHVHHGLECPAWRRRDQVGDGRRSARGRDLPRQAPTVLKPAAGAGLARRCRRWRSTGGRSRLVFGGHLEREGCWAERRPAVQAQAGNAQHGELDRQHVASWPGRGSRPARAGRRPRCCRQGGGVEARASSAVPSNPQAHGVPAGRVRTPARPRATAAVRHFAHRPGDWGAFADISHFMPSGAGR